MTNILWNAYLFEKPRLHMFIRVICRLSLTVNISRVEKEYVAGTIPSSYACILAWGRGWSVRFISCDFLLI